VEITVKSTRLLVALLYVHMYVLSELALYVAQNRRIVSWIKRHCRRFFKNLFCPKSGKSNVYLVKVNRQPHLKLPFTTGGATFPSGEL
jgi:hypothetical protein